MKCKYCHKPVGLFSSKHKECELKHFALLSDLSSTYKCNFLGADNKQ